MRTFNKLILLLIILFPYASWAESMKPEIRQASLDGLAMETPGYLGFLMERGVRFFQVFISPVDGDRCPSSPTCSAFGREAYKKHGAFWGTLLTFDRLIHEGDEGLVSIHIRDGNISRIYDPVENNVFWWKKHNH